MLPPISGGQTFEPTKGLVVIAADDVATVKILPAKVFHTDEETLKRFVNGEIKLEASVENGYVVFSTAERVESAE